jgi:hypothetical protein
MARSDLLRRIGPVHSRTRPAIGIGIVIGFAFRVAIGLSVIACMTVAAMWANGVV